jgi:hypothetical protein
VILGWIFIDLVLLLCDLLISPSADFFFLGCGRPSRRGGLITGGIGAEAGAAPALTRRTARRGCPGTGSHESTIDSEVDYHLSSLSLALILFF